MSAWAALRTVRPGERSAVLLASAYFFLLLASWFLIRPVRDEMGVAGGVRNLPWLFTGTLIGALVVTPLFSMLVARWQRRRFIPYAYRFLALSLAGFYVTRAWLAEDWQVFFARAFFIYTSVFNVFVVAVFWGFMADIFSKPEGQRLFPLIGAGGTLGAIAGGAITASLVQHLGLSNMLLLSIVLLEGCLWCVARLDRLRPTNAENPDSPGRSHGFDRDVDTSRPDVFPAGQTRSGAVSGILRAVRSPYMAAISVHMLLMTVGPTFLYMEQARIVERTFDAPEQRAQFFGQIDLGANTLCLLLQLFIAGRVVQVLGIGWTLSLFPAVLALGFTALAFWPVAGVLLVVQAAQRASHHGLSKPAREVLFTIVPRTDKYAAKTFIDTFVYRAGDQLGAWGYAWLLRLGAGLPAFAGWTIGVCVGWIGLSLWLGRRVARHTASDAARVARAGAPSLSAP